MEQTPPKNANPILNVNKNGSVLFSNDAGNALLNEWGLEVGEKLPSSIGDLVQRVISLNRPEKMEVSVGKKVYLFFLRPLPKQDCVNISGFDISHQKEIEARLLEAYQQIETQSKELNQSKVELQAQSKELRESYDILHVRDNEILTLTENSPDLIGRFDRQNHCLYANPAFMRFYFIPPLAKFYSWSASEFINKTQAKLKIDPELVKLSEKQRANVFVTGKSESLDFRYISPQGEEYYFDTKIIPEFVNGEVTSVLVISRDITERKEAEAKLKETLDSLEEKVKERTSELEEAFNSLKESEERLAEAQKIAHIGNWERNLVTGDLYWSNEMYSIFGRNPQEGVPDYNVLLNYIHPEDRDFMCEKIKRASNGESYSTDHRIILHNGEVRTFHAQAEVVFDERNIPVRIMGTTQDITERKRSEESLQKQAALIDLSPDAIIARQLDGTITFWNKGAQSLYGWTSREAIGQQAHALLKTLFPQPFEQINEQILKTGFWSGELIHCTKNDRQVIIQSRWQAKFDDHGNVKDILESNVDITERKQAEDMLRQSEERLLLAQQAARIGTFEWNIQTGVNIWTPELEAMYGLRPGEFGKTEVAWEQMVHPEDRQNAIRMVEQAIQTGEPTEYEWRVIWSDGSVHWMMGRWQVFKDATGQPLRMTGVNIDITERKESEENLSRSEVARKQEIHHRIKNNLQVISSLLDLQAEKFKGKKNIKDSQVLEAFKESQDRVISMALIHEELHKGGKLDTLNFSNYIEELADNLLLTYRVGNSISLNTDVEEDVFFDMDTAVPLGMIINELVSNSLKYAFPDRENGEIQINLHREGIGEFKSEDCNPAYVLTVSDNGKGIPEDLDIEDIDSLGLQLVTTLVDQLDGELELKRDNGTEFIIRFSVTGNDGQKLTKDQLQFADNE